MKSHIPHPPDGPFFGTYGGQFVPESLKPVLDQLTREFETAWADASFRKEYHRCLREIAGRPSELYFAQRLTEKIGGAKIYLKREDMNHTGAHKINNTLGQALLTKRMGKTRVIAETGAGQHGVATATAAAVFGLECEIYMGAEDVRRQALNVFRMKLLGANVVSVQKGQKTLSDAVDAAIENWLDTYNDTHYVLGSVCGPHPFPLMVREFQKVIGEEARQQMLDVEGRLPDLLVACVGGGSNAAGLFTAMIDDENVQMLGVEAGGRSLNLGDHAATLTLGKPGILHGSKCYVVQDESGQTAPVHSVSAGLDYPGVGPEHSHWKDTGRVQYTFCTDDDAIDALMTLSQTEGIIPALESSHAVSGAMKAAAKMSKNSIVLVNLSGRGDKDCNEIQEILARKK